MSLENLISLAKDFEAQNPSGCTRISISDEAVNITIQFCENTTLKTIGIERQVPIIIAINSRVDELSLEFNSMALELKNHCNEIDWCDCYEDGITMNNYLFHEVPSSLLGEKI